MENLLQFYQPDYNSFTMSNPMQLSSPIIQTGPTLEEDDTDYKQIICDGKKYLSCTFPGCGKIYRYKSEFVRHKVIHTSQRTISCPFKGCTKTFKREDVLKSHMRIHTGETPFKCSEPDCGQSFSSQAGLKYHGLKHKGEKEFRCSFPGCNKTFLIQSQLKQHESTLNYHQKIMNHNSPHTSHTSEEEYNASASPVKVVKYEETREVKSEEKVEWGVKVKTEPEQNEKPSRNIEKEFERMIEALVNENNAMKLKLNKINSLRGLSSPDNVKEENKCPELPQERNFAYIKLEAQ